MAARIQVPVDPLRDAEFDRAFELLRGVVDGSAIDREFSLAGERRRYQQRRVVEAGIAVEESRRFIGGDRPAADGIAARLSAAEQACPRADVVGGDRVVPLRADSLAASGRAAEWFAQHGPCA